MNTVAKSEDIKSLTNDLNDLTIEVYDIIEYNIRDVCCKVNKLKQKTDKIYNELETNQAYLIKIQKLVKDLEGIADEMVKKFNISNEMSHSILEMCVIFNKLNNIIEDAFKMIDKSKIPTS